MFQHTVSAQCSPQCSCGSPDGSWSPLYRMLTPSPPSENDIVPRGPPPRCSCGCSPRRLPPRLPTPPPSNDHRSYGVSSLSGVVMDSPVFQQVGPATVIQTPTPMYSLSSPDDQGQSCDTNSHHIMTIPRRQDTSVTFNSYDSPSNAITTMNDSPPTETYCTAPNAKPPVIYSSTSDESPSTTYTTAPQQMSCQPLQSNSVMPAPQRNFSPQPPPPQPQPMYYTQPAPVFASCPATLFYPAPPTLTCPQPSFIYPAPPSYPSAPAVPTISQSFTPGINSHTTYSTTDNTPSNNYPMPPPSQGIPCNAPQAAPSPSHTLSNSNFQSTPSNTVTFSTSDVQQTPSNSENLNTNFQQQQTPSNTIFFHDSDSTGGTGTLLPETQPGSTTTTHDSPLTYTLLTSGTNNGADASRDCSVPVPPVLV